MLFPIPIVPEYCPMCAAKRPKPLPPVFADEPPTEFHCPACKLTFTAFAKFTMKELLGKEEKE